MAQRGRGCLEVKKSLNPFMQTGSSDIGFRATQIEWNRPAVNVEEMVLPPAQGEDNGNFMFLYTRESDTIGSQLAKPQHSLAYEPKSKGDLLREKRDRLRALKETSVKKDLEPQDLEDARAANVVACISSWKPCIKEEDPRYTTANNEIGTVNDIAGIGEVTRNAGVVFHVDAAQSAGKIEINMETMKVDLLAMSAHKMYGPKGIGALYVRRKPRVRLEAQMHGGGHERGMRSGTLATHQIVGMGEAARIAREEMALDAAHSRALRQRFWDGIKDIEEVHINGDEDARLPGAINVSIAFVEGESLIMSLKDLAISSGSACTSASLEPSYVLRALGLNDELAHSSLRFAFGRFTTEEDVDHAIAQLRTAVDKLRELSPLWDMYKDGVDLSTIEWAAH